MGTGGDRAGRPGDAGLFTETLESLPIAAEDEEEGIGKLTKDLGEGRDRSVGELPAATPAKIEDTRPPGQIQSLPRGFVDHVIILV